MIRIIVLASTILAATRKSSECRPVRNDSGIRAIVVGVLLSAFAALFVAAPVSAESVRVTMTGMVTTDPLALASIDIGDPVTATFVVDLDAPGFALTDGEVVSFTGEWMAHATAQRSGSVTIGDSVTLPYAPMMFQSRPGVLVRNNASLLLNNVLTVGPLDGLSFGGVDPDAAYAGALQVDGNPVFGYEAFLTDTSQAAFDDALLDNVQTATFGDFDLAELQIYFSEAAVGDPATTVYIDLDTYSVTSVPVPAAVWLLGSALGLLGWMKRRGT